MVTIEAFDEGLEIRNTLDVTTPDTGSALYKETFEWKQKGGVKAVAIDKLSGEISPFAGKSLNVVKEGWKLIGTFQNLKESGKMFDGNENTFWNTDQQFSVELVIDLGEELTLNGFLYLPDQCCWDRGIIFNYEYFVSDDMRSWGKPVSKGEFSNIKNSPIWQEKKFTPANGRCIKLRALSSATENGRISLAELDVLTE